MWPSSSTSQGSRHASPWSGSVPVGSRFGTISSQPNAPPSTNPFAVGWSTPMPWSRSSSPSRRRDVIRPPRSGRISSAQRWALILTTLIVLAACTRTSVAVRPTPSPSTPASSTVESPSPSAEPMPSPTPAPTHVFVIVLENRSYSQAMATPYIAELAARYGLATDYHGTSHPSLPNYLALTSGSTWGVADDGWHP